MLRFYVLVIILIIPKSSWPQFGAGVFFGATTNTVTSNADMAVNSRHRSLLGGNIGFQSIYNVTTWLALQADLEYMQKNTRQQRYGFYEGVFKESRNYYLQVPISTRFSFGGSKIGGFLNLGGYAAYWMSGRTKGVAPNILTPFDNPEPDTKISDLFAQSSYNEKYRFRKDRDNRFEGGLLVGVGIQYQAWPNKRIFAQTRYYYATTNQVKETIVFPVRTYNQTLQLSVGASISLTKNPPNDH